MKSSSLNILGSAAIILLAVAVVVYLAMQVRYTIPLDRSAIGFDGLAQLLSEQDREARTFSGGAELELETAGLRVIPVYHQGYSVSAWMMGAGRERAYLDAPARSMPRWVLEQKTQAAPTLIVLPKWSDGVRLSALAHPDFLLNNPYRSEPEFEDPMVREVEVEAIEADVDADAADTDTDAQGEEDTDRTVGEVVDINEIDWFEESSEDPGDRFPFALPEPYLRSIDTRQVETVSTPSYGDATLAAAQFMRLPETCEPVIGEQNEALLARCFHGEDKTQFWVLSDPDLLNNYGLHQGQNARTALALIDDLSQGQDIVIDYTTQVWAREVEDRRTIAELFRFVAPPFTWLWLAAVLLFALAWWRGAVRDRPIFSLFSHGYRGARDTVIKAQARLMRNTGRDGALLRVLAHQRVLALCDHLLGRDDRSSNRQARMLAFVERRNPDLAERLSAALNEAQTVPEHLAAGAAVALLTRLETAYEEARQLA